MDNRLPHKTISAKRGRQCLNERIHCTFYMIMSKGAVLNTMNKQALCFLNLRSWFLKRNGEMSN